MAEQVLKRHPIRGGIWGIPTGLGLGLLAVNSQTVSLSITTLVVAAIVGIVIGSMWASFGPAKKPKGSTPSSSPEPVVEADPLPIDQGVETTSAPAPPMPSPESSDVDDHPGAP